MRSGSLSYWQSTVSAIPLSTELPRMIDVAVIGGGLLGTATCFWLASQGVSVALLERSALAAGATGRNGGFVVAGPAESHPKAIAHLGHEATRAVMEVTYESQTLLRQVLQEEAIACDYRETGTIRLALTQEQVQQLTQEVEMRQADGFPAHFLWPEHVQTFIQTPLAPEILGGRLLPDQGLLHPAQLVHGLARAALRRGAHAYQAEVYGLVPEGNLVRIKTSRGTLLAHTAIVAVNAWASTLLLMLADIIGPVREQMLAYAPVKPVFSTGVSATVTTDEYWQQTPDGVMVIGVWVSCPQRRYRHLGECSHGHRARGDRAHPPPPLSLLRSSTSDPSMGRIARLHHGLASHCGPCSGDAHGVLCRWVLRAWDVLWHAFWTIAGSGCPKWRPSTGAEAFSVGSSNVEKVERYAGVTEQRTALSSCKKRAELFQQGPTFQKGSLKKKRRACLEPSATDRYPCQRSASSSPGPAHRHLRGGKEPTCQRSGVPRGIELLTPIARAILEEANALFLNGTGEIQVIGPQDDGSGGLETRFELSWPEQREAQVTRGPHEPLQPLRIVVNYSQSFLHPHLSGSSAGSWPFQVTSEIDAERQRGILAAIVELELHQRLFETDWRILPVSRQWE